LVRVGPLNDTSKPPALLLNTPPLGLLNDPAPSTSSVKLPRFALNVPWLLMTAAASDRLIEPAVQVAVPVFVQGGPVSVLVAPFRAETPAVVKVPPPVIVPPDQLNAVLTVTAPAPFSVPPDTPSVVAVRLPVAVSVPPWMLMTPVLDEVPSS